MPLTGDAARVDGTEVERLRSAGGQPFTRVAIEFSIDPSH